MTVRVDADGTVLVALLDGLRPAPGARVLLGLTGAPGAGKSTLARHLAALTDGGAVVVPMDGFHLADGELDRQGLRDRKGAPETFDGWGYAALLRRLRAREEPVVYAPAFERDLEQPLAGAIAVPAATTWVVTEGNYLLLDDAPWRAARAALDAVWFVHTADDLRRARLHDRHVRWGKKPDHARDWVSAVDEPNAALVAAGRERADVVLDLTDWVPG